MKLQGIITEGFLPFRDGQEHTLQACEKCGTTIKATQVNGPAVADVKGNITGAFFLNLWLCRRCYENLVVKKGYVNFGMAGVH